MKKAFYIIIFILLTRQFLGQTNLVVNPSFETYTACPNTLDQLDHCQGWSSYRSSPDYYHTCSSTSILAPPNTAFGYQWPHTGNAYSGIVTFDNTGTSPNYREIIGSGLTTTLQIGQKYFVSFFINRGGSTGLALASNKIGMRFSTVPFSKTIPVPINNFAHYYPISIITDTTNWVLLKGSFIADSTYKYIMIGNFFNDLNTDTLSTGQFNQSTYYLIDDICVSTDSTFASTWTTGINENSSSVNFKLYPNPASEFVSIIFPNQSKISQLNLLDKYGQIIMTKSNFYTDKIELNTVSEGLYFLQIISNGKTFYDKIIVRH